MFPTIRLKFSGLKESAKYVVMIEMQPVDEKRYRYSYQKSSWIPAGKMTKCRQFTSDCVLNDAVAPNEVTPNEVFACSAARRIYMHPSSPMSGSQLNNLSLAFDKLKLTNNSKDKNGYVCIS